ncbi:MAG: flagellar motor protein MotB [Candidatus Krumholzibacteriota bacterium]|nr:flagellar motor protein MotB [Candidatus Krumholzibacteriota bacterium]
MKRKKKKGGDEAGAPAWMVTYGDLMSLLLCFFVMLVSMSSISEAKFKKAVGSLLGAMGVMIMDSSLIEMEELPHTDRYDQEIERILDEFNEFQEFVEEMDLRETVEITETDEGTLIRIANPVLFRSGAATMTESGQRVLTQLAAVLLEFDSQVRIEGHTDNVPISTALFPSNWELSARRAINVLKHFNKYGIPGRNLTAVGRGEYSPLVENDTPANRAQNRRVEIFVDYKEKLRKQTDRGLIFEEVYDGR